MLYRLYSNTGRKKNHDFIRHYKNGQVKPFELKPKGIEQYGLITKCAISAYKHKDEYDFYNAETVVTRFAANNDVIIKVEFTIENIQPSPEEIGTPIINSRYWLTEPYRTRYLVTMYFLA